VGNVKPWSSITVRITYVADVKIDGDAVTFFLPTYVAPRYTPASEGDPLPAGGVHPPHEGLRFDLVAAMASEIKAIESKTPGIGLKVDEAGSPRVRTVALATEVMSLDKDLIIRITTAEPHQPRCLVEHDKESDTYAGVVTLCPHIEFDDERRELVFLVDRSGSMGGYDDDSNIAQAKRALQLFCRSLPEDCYINIIGFGSRQDWLWPESVKYGEESLAKATKHIENLKADLGGTEICAPLRSLLAQKVREGYDRQVFVLTDGQVSNTAETVEVVRSAVAKMPKTRVFALGLGHGASHELVEGIAEAGRGAADFSVDKNALQGKVIRQLKHALQPALNEVSIAWEGAAGAPPDYAAGEDGGGAAPAEAEASPQKKKSGLLSAFAPSSVGSLLGFAKKSPKPINPADAEGYARAPYVNPAIVSGERFVSYILVAKGGRPPAAVTITAKSPAGDLDVRLPVAATDVVEGKLLHTMAARALINDLQKGRSWMHGTGAVIKNEIVRLGTTYSLASKHTSFVAVQKKGEVRQLAPHLASPVPHDPSLVNFNSNLVKGGGRGGRRRARASARNAGLGMACAAPMPAPSRAACAAPMPPGAPPPATFGGGGFGGAPPPAAFGGGGFGGGMMMRKSATAKPAKMKKKKGKSIGMKKMDNSSRSKKAVEKSSLEVKESLSFDAGAVNFAKEDEEDDDSDDDFSEEAAESRLAPAGEQQLSQEQRLQTLIALQNFSGSFDLNAALATAVSIDLAELEKLLDGDIADTAAARRLAGTAIAIAFLRARLPELEPQWELVAAKALKWLGKEAKAVGTTANESLDAAATKF